jgi:hypothetical protein
VNIGKSASYTDEQIAGRSEPWKVYNSSGSTMIDFAAKLMAMGESKSPWPFKEAVSLAGQIGNRVGLGGLLGVATTYAPRLYRNIMDLVGNNTGDEITSTTFTEVIKQAVALEALVYPQYNDDGIAFPPPMVYLKYGPLTRRGIIRDVRFRLRPPWDVATGLPMLIECNVTMEEVNRVPKSFLQVRNYQLSDNGAAGQQSEVVPFKSSIYKRAREVFGL